MASGDHRRSGEIEKNCRPKNPCKLLRKVVELLEHPISRDLRQRQRQLICDFLEATQYAYWLRDVPHLIRLFEAITKTSGRISWFNNEIEQLLVLCAIPPMLTKPSDRLEYHRDLQQYFSMLGYLTISLKDENFTNLLFDSILGLLQRPKPVGYCCAALDFCEESASKSNLPEITAQFLGGMNDCLYGKLLQINIVLARISDGTCAKILQQNALEYLLCRLEPKWHDKTIQLLWLLLNSIQDDHGVEMKTLSLSALSALTESFKFLTISKNHNDRRNDLTAIILKILKDTEVVDLIGNTLGADIVSLSILTEGIKITSSQEVWVDSCVIEFRSNDTDVLFKKLLLSCLIYFDKHGAAQLLEKFQIAKGLVRILKNQSNIEWHPDYRCDFVMIVLRILPKICPICIEQILITEIPIVILAMVESFSKQNYNMNLLFNCVHCLNELLYLKNDAIKNMIGNNNGFQIILKLCSHLLSDNILSKIHQFVMGRSFLILTTFCDEHKDNDIAILNLVMNYLKRLLKPSDEDPMCGTKITVCAILLLWKMIKTCKALCQEFVKRGGIYLLLDAVQHCSFPVKTVSLGALVDVIVKGQGIPHFITWRQSGQGLLSMLMEIFRGENHNSMNYYESEFAVANKLKTSRHLSLCNEKPTYLLVTRDRLIISCRLKIHSIIAALTENYQDEVEIANDHYKLFPENLQADDQVTLLFAKNYLSLRVCEAWRVMRDELNQERIDITEDDRIDLEETERLVKNWKSHLQGCGENILGAEVETAQIGEVFLYQTLKESKLTESLEGLRELIYISKCTEPMFQMRRKLIQSHEVDVCVKGKRFTNHHKTTQENTATANIFNQTVSIECDFVKKRDEEIVDFLPVSDVDITGPHFDLTESDDITSSDDKLTCN